MASDSRAVPVRAVEEPPDAGGVQSLKASRSDPDLDELGKARKEAKSLLATWALEEVVARRNPMKVGHGQG